MGRWKFEVGDKVRITTRNITGVVTGRDRASLWDEKKHRWGPERPLYSIRYERGAGAWPGDGTWASARELEKAK